MNQLKVPSSFNHNMFHSAETPLFFQWGRCVDCRHVGALWPWVGAQTYRKSVPRGNRPCRRKNLEHSLKMQRLHEQTILEGLLDEKEVRG